jgi:hypothetical protein
MCHSNGRSAGQWQIKRLGVVIKGLLLFLHMCKIQNLIGTAYEDKFYSFSRLSSE